MKTINKAYRVMLILKNKYGEIYVREAFTQELFKSVGDVVPPKYEDDFKHEKWTIVEFVKVDITKHVD